jgi:hypothetical protein
MGRRKGKDNDGVDNTGQRLAISVLLVSKGFPVNTHYFPQPPFS